MRERERERGGGGGTNRRKVRQTDTRDSEKVGEDER